jgi:WD40 repeat protein
MSEDGQAMTAASADDRPARSSVRNATSVVRRSQRFRRALESLGLLPAPPEGLAFHAFISYSHAADGPLARALQRGLQRFAKPWNRARALHVFRDEASMAVNPNLWKEIERALDASDYYILLASPPAADSYWVRKEAERWVQTKPSDHLLLALTAGEIVWDRTKGDFDWEQTTALPPTLRGVFGDEPLWVDLRWAREATDLSLSAPRFTDAVVSLAAPIHGRPRDELAGEEVRQHRRTMRIARAAVAVLLTLTAIAVALAAFALIQRQRAIDQTHVAQSQLLAREATSIPDPQRASLLAIGAYRLAPTADARSAILTLADNQELGRPLSSTGSAVNGIAFAPHGRTLASASQDGKIRFWDLSTRRQLGASLTATRTGEVTSVAFGPDGRTLASAGGDGMVRLWSASTRREIHGPLTATSKRPGSSADAVAFSPDGRTLASGGDDGTLRFWNVASGRELGPPLAGSRPVLAADSYRHIPSPVNAVAFSRDGRMLATGAGDGMVRLWDVPGHRKLGAPLIASTDSYVSSVALSPDGQTLASATRDGNVEVWDLATRRELGAPLTASTGVKLDDTALSVAFSPDGRTLTSAGGDGTVRIWDVARRRELNSPLTADDHGAVNAVAYSPDGRAVASGEDDGTIRLWLVANRREFGPPLDISSGEIINSIAISPDGRTLASASFDGKLRFWDISTRRELGAPVPAAAFLDAGLNSVAFSPEGRTLATASGGTIRFWDVATHRTLGSPLTQNSETNFESLAFSPDGRILAAASEDGKVRLWDTATRRMLGKPLIADSPDGTPSIAFSRDGGKLVTSGSDGMVRVWEVRHRRMLMPPLKVAGYSGVLSPDGQTLAVVTNSTVQLWNIMSRQRLGPPLTATAKGSVWDLAFTPDGSTLVSADGDGTIRFWDVAARRQVGPPLTASTGGQVSAVVFSLNGRMLASGGYDGTIRFWTNYPIATYIRQICSYINLQDAPRLWRQTNPTIPYQKPCGATERQ